MRFSTFASVALLGLGAAALQQGLPSAGELRQKLQAEKSRHSLKAKRAETDLGLLYPPHNLSVPIDFFHNETRYEPHTNDTFNLRYWFDATYYKPGGPVFVLLGGETYGDERLPFLQKGIVHQVIEATGGLGVILEHRYYGESFPYPTTSLENLRFLSTEQALAEVDYFARNVKFDGIDADLTAPNTPWVVYGGSYAGAQAAFLRVVYPDTFWGAISSSGVTVAIYDYWEYFEPIRIYGPPDCISATQTFISVLDGILLSNNTASIKQLKDAFRFGGVSNNQDFANIFTDIYGWQSTNWDPEENSPSFYNYCTNITGPLNYPNLESERSTAASLVAASGHGNNTATVDTLLNAIGWYGVKLSAQKKSGKSQDEFFTTLNATYWKDTSITAANAYRSWSYQVCTEWGYIQTGSTPPNIQPLISRTLDLEYLTEFCRLGYERDEPPAIENINKYGGFNISYPRLAHIGGNADPWRPATPLWYPDAREDTIEEPWHLISHGVHHWEENGIFPNETTPTLPPYPVIYAQQYLKNFVIEWLKEWKTSGYQSEL
ncbi:serine peptidase-like protein [Bimuria novae-zelandiae CBS 107.79]|uniref:Serine peptidase-like protein n=1 Tax=Bimuria novae-zelandiae CBS 107.79 TaxID=1447943 RepID=A0A6A5VVU7_9PLEO|nr:serine peptidase-like protein [Bimuria novae-zelandiae CBS 107.79]